MCLDIHTYFVNDIVFLFFVILYFVIHTDTSHLLQESLRHSNGD